MRNILFSVILWLGALSASAATPPAWVSHLASSVQAVGSQGKVPVLVFDLDDTLVLTAPRTFAILRSWSAQAENRRRFPEVARTLAGIREPEVQYSVADTFRILGLQDPEAQASVESYWKDRFFTSQALTVDRVVTGGSAFVGAFVKLGARIVYLTGRPRPKMGEGTVKELKRLRFPLGSGIAELWMKPSVEMPDLDFKKKASEWLAHQEGSEVLAVFENEPANLRALSESFPKALPVFLLTSHSPKPGWVPKNTILLKGFPKTSP